MPTTKKITNVSLFAGCGGFDLGFSRVGIKTVWANDFDKYAQDVYKMNLGTIDGRDIKKVPHEEILDSNIITAGFPCQPFSNAGKRLGVSDPRGDLYLEVLKIIKEKTPDVVVIENVRGLMSTKLPSGEKLIDVMVKDIEHTGEYGYNVTSKLINASDHRVPQNRYRIFVIGVRKDLGKSYEFPKKSSKEGLELKHVLDDVDGKPNHIDWPLSPQSLSMVKHIPEGGSWKSVPYDLLPERLKRIRDNMKKYRSPNFYRRYSREEITGTITASAQPENCGIIHPTKDRRFTIREIARIQTFPDDFMFIDSNLAKITAMYKVIGNAVPVTLAESIAQSIIQQIYK